VKDTATILARLDAMIADAPFRNPAFPADAVLIAADAVDAAATALDQHGAALAAEEQRAFATALRNRASRARTLAGVLTPMERHQHAIPLRASDDMLRRDRSRA
jgi:hypothetical protein